MCLDLFLATTTEIPLDESPDLSVQKVSDSEDAVRRFFSLPHVRSIGAHTGCACGFPHVAAEAPVEWFDGFFDSDTPDDRAKNLASIRRLFTLIGDQLAQSGVVELYPVWWSDTEEPSKGTITISFDQLDAERFFFNERFLLRIERAAQA